MSVYVGDGIRAEIDTGSGLVTLTAGLTGDRTLTLSCPTVAAIAELIVSEYSDAALTFVEALNRAEEAGR